MVKKGTSFSIGSFTTLSIGGLFLSTVALFARKYLTTGPLYENVSNSTPLGRNDNDFLPVEKKERGKVLSAKGGFAELYEVYEGMRDKYYQKAFHCDVDAMKSSECNGEWKILKDTDGIQISLMHHASDPSCPYIRMTGVMEAPIHDVWNYLSLENWDDSMRRMDPFYEGLDIIKQTSYENKTKKRKKKASNASPKDPHEVEIVLARKRLTRLVTFGKRDFTYVQVSDVPRKDGLWICGTVSVVTDELPRAKGYTRGFQDSVSFYEPLYDGNNQQLRTRLTLVTRYDLNDSSADGTGGAVPMWLYVKNVGAIGSMAFKTMEKDLLKSIENR